MKRQIALAIAVLLFSLVTFSTVASAQRETANIQHAKIPFAFHVEDKTFPAGEYEIRWMGPRLVVQETGGTHRALLAVARIDRLETNERNYLRFNRYGGNYFFREVWVAGMNSGHEVLPSKLEKEVASQQRSNDYALVALNK